MTGFKGRVVVVGAGRSGRAAAALAASQGWGVVLWDEQREAVSDPRWEVRSGPLELDALLGADRVVMSPGIDATRHPVLRPAEDQGVPVLGEVGFAAETIDVPVVGVTGTNGKSTVTSFIGHLLGEALPGRTFVGGNLGTPVSEAVLNGGYDRMVLELSSYQLERSGRLRPRVGVILNLTPDHLARHGTMEGYARAKWNIMAHADADDLCFVPAANRWLEATDPGCGRRARIGSLPGVRRSGSDVEVVLDGAEAGFDLSQVALVGAHNLDHAATAAAVAWAMGAPADRVQSALAGLRPLEHRMEVVHQARGVTWINDSKATNVAAVEVALTGLSRRAVVLLGGQLKEGGEAFQTLIPALSRHVAVVCFGAGGAEVAGALAPLVDLEVRVVSDLDAAVVMAGGLASEGEVVLLSPGGASFDAFEDFEHRGRAFADAAIRVGGA